MAAVSSVFAQEQSVEQIVESIFSGIPIRFIDKQEVKFLCDCSWERFEEALVTLGAEELQELVDGGETIETMCHFCSKRYQFTVDQLKSVLQGLVNSRE
jgi:molecular chaperone Hsp33